MGYRRDRLSLNKKGSPLASAFRPATTILMIAVYSADFMSAAQVYH